MRVMGWIVAISLWGMVATTAWALTIDQREIARQQISLIRQKCEQILNWVDFVDQVQTDGWKYEAMPITGETLTKTYDAAAQTSLQGRYDALKTDLQALVNALP